MRPIEVFDFTGQVALIEAVGERDHFLLALAEESHGIDHAG